MRFFKDICCISLCSTVSLKTWIEPDSHTVNYLLTNSPDSDAITIFTNVCYCFFPHIWLPTSLQLYPSLNTCGTGGGSVIWSGKKLSWLEARLDHIYIWHEMEYLSWHRGDSQKFIFSSDSHFLTVRNRVFVHPAVPERPAVGGLGWRHAPEREGDWLVVTGMLGKLWDWEQFVCLSNLFACF